MDSRTRKVRTKHLITLSMAGLLGACFGGTGEQDTLRDAPSATGISLGLQVNLARDASTADSAATIFKDGARQPLVGGDFFIARSSVDDAVLKSLENLSGDYSGRLNVQGEGDTVTISTEYDPIRAREDRWYPVDQLQIDPGPNPDLVGYTSEVIFPAPLEITSARTATYTDPDDDIVLTWTAGSSDQMTANAIVTCSDASNKTYTFPVFNVLGSSQNSNNPDGAGTYTLQVSDIIPNTNIIEAVATFQHEVATIITAALLEYYTFGLISATNIPLSTFQVESCDVQLTVFRENDYSENLPDGVGGFIVGSTSDTVTFRFVP